MKANPIYANTAPVESMIERVARALYARRPNGGGLVGGPYQIHPWESIGDFAQGEHIAAARAAIEAMREPTAAMADAADGAMDEASYEDNDGNSAELKSRGRGARILLNAMIDAALKE